MAVMVAAMKHENKEGQQSPLPSGFSNPWLSRMRARCDGPHLSVLPTEPIKRANPQKLKDIFNKYASEVKDGVKFMKYSDFVQHYLGVLDFENYNQQTLNAIGRILDVNKTGLISFEAFQEFEGVLCQPDALYRLAFRLFDTDGAGFLEYKAFETLLKQTNLFKFFPFNFDSDFVKLHFGKKKERRISYEEFTQVLWEYHEEHALQAFNKYDADNAGYITLVDFKNILDNTVPHLMTSFVRASIPLMVYDQQRISYAYFKAFVSLLNNIELFKKIYTTTTKQNLTKDVFKWEFLQQAQHFTQVTPLEVNILYQLVALLHPDGKLNYKDLETLAPLDVDKMPYRIQARVISEAVEDLKENQGRSYLTQIFESSYRFALGSVAGAVGATAVYPIDLVKTRMQNQRVGTMVGELLYKNSLDCFKKVIRFEGFFGLYRGLTPQLIGVAPEKAIKLTMNDLVRDKTAGADGTLPLWAEILAGGCAGGSQVVFTNPLEIVKIRLQVAGEVATSARPSAMSVIKDLGFFGLYKGAKACFLRDIPFSAIYFPVYAHMKKYLADENGYNKPSTLFLAALTAGVPAASLVTPADVIKTRLQVQARKGQTTYSGLIDCARKIWREEGGRAFWKGAGARVFRSSPQFGVTLLTYEMLQRAFYIDFGGRRLEGSQQATVSETYHPQNDDHIGGYRFVGPTFDGVEMRFGLCLPRFRNV